ncbi:MAG TPA: R3H domain-containing nucleic acid-binding protein [Armatimonadota bacterium]|jgi:stage III sporulation protein SpoIIIAA
MAEQPPIIDDMHLLMNVLPPHIRTALESHAQVGSLLEVVLDLGREPEARFPGTYDTIVDNPITVEDIEYVVARVGAFGDDNRAGIPRTLHRISAIRNRQGKIVGLTCRVGRSVLGTIDILRDVVEAGKSILILGRPGVGKTTKLREVARVLADDMKKRVVVVDTSNEIAGDGDIPHPAIGRARRMQVPRVEKQHDVMIEAVENHMPEVIVIDEIGNEAEALASRTIAERGVQLVGTAHGNTLDNLLQNPTLNDLLGGIHAVTLSDEEARHRGTQKTVLERKAPPTFEVVVEMVEQDKLAVHHDIADVVDRMLRGAAPTPEIRIATADGIERVAADVLPDLEEHYESARWGDYQGYVEETPAARLPRNKEIYIYPYGVARNKLDRAIQEMHLNALMARHLEDADAIITVKQQERRDAARLQDAVQRGIPVHVIRNNTYQQIVGALNDLFHGTNSHQMDVEVEALHEVRDAIREVMATSRPIELKPRNAYLRRLQHKLANEWDLTSESIGAEPLRRLRISK